MVSFPKNYPPAEVQEDDFLYPIPNTGNSGSSFRNSTPRYASGTSPGVRPVPEGAGYIDYIIKMLGFPVSKVAT